MPWRDFARFHGCRVRSETAPQVLAVLRTALVHLLATVDAQSLPVAIEQLQIHPDRARELIGIPQGESRKGAVEFLWTARAAASIPSHEWRVSWDRCVAPSRFPTYTEFGKRWIEIGRRAVVPAGK